MEAMTLTEQDIERLKALVKKADLREGKWQSGIAGHNNLVAYNGEDITGIAIVEDPARLAYIAALRNAVNAGLLDYALRGMRPERDARLRRFTMYRRAVPTETHDENQRNASNEPQFEGVIFSDGRVAVRWLTLKRSTSCWDSFDDMMAIHGHPEYVSEIVWHDAEKGKP